MEAGTAARSFLLRVFIVYIFAVLEGMDPVAYSISHDQLKRLKYGFPEQIFLFRTGGEGLMAMCSPVALMLYPFIVIALVYKKGQCNEEIWKAWLGPSLLYPLTGSIVNIIKIFAGRPRPTYFARCYGDSFKDYLDLGYKCTGDKNFVLEGLKSFPSGTTALAFASGTYIWLYVAGKSRMMAQPMLGAVKDGVWLASFIVVFPVMIAVSRVVDGNQHVEDVIVGALIGIVVANGLYFHYYPQLCSPRCYLMRDAPPYEEETLAQSDSIENPFFIHSLRHQRNAIIRVGDGSIHGNLELLEGYDQNTGGGGGWVEAESENEADIEMAAEFTATANRAAALENKISTQNSMAVQNDGGFDRVFKYVGSNGKYQYTLLLVVSIQCIILSWHHLSYVFLGAVPDHWCHIPELVGSGWTNDQIRNLSIPLKNNGEGWESCEYFNHNYAHLASLPYEKALTEASKMDVDDIGRLSCKQGWIFDRKTYESTLVTQFEIVCENRYLVATIQASHWAGVFIGSLILGSLSDQIIGRRKSVLISIIFVIVGGIAATFSRSYWELIFCRFFVAFGLAGAYQNCLCFVMEYAGTTSRSAMGMIQQLPFALGYMLMAGYAYFLRDWKTLQFAYSITAVILLSYFWILPESARWLAVSGQTEKSLKLLLKVAERNKKTVNREELYRIVLSCDARDAKRNPVTFTIAETPIPSRNVCLDWTRKVWHPIKKTLSIYLSLLATPEMRRRTLVIWFLFISVDLVYYGVVFDSATLTNDPYLLVFLG
ncbi:Organic cation transporter protein [Orchesella cincta]|uniref:Organic cation transporter protein n=1 Tax=Orchesella cincta TaxID=48709 RepID=A0A1D2MK36_ORCCI|nr:Organic cation transporter protein [Orchesella cincta]